MKLIKYLRSRTHPAIWRAAIAIVGGVVVVIGIIMIPYPGPGWLVVFLGLGILSTEFAWAKKWLDFGRKKYDDWSLWVKRQRWHVQAILFAFTTLVVIATIWLVNGYGLINQWLHLGQDWLRSPFIG